LFWGRGGRNFFEDPGGEIAFFHNGREKRPFIEGGRGVFVKEDDTAASLGERGVLTNSKQIACIKGMMGIVVLEGGDALTAGVASGERRESYERRGKRKGAFSASEEKKGGLSANKGKGGVVERGRGGAIPPGGGPGFTEARRRRGDRKFLTMTKGRRGRLRGGEHVPQKKGALQNRRGDDQPHVEVARS